MISLVASPFYAFPALAEEESNYILPAYDGNTIHEDVIIKPNIPTTDEEVELVRKYDAEQKRIAEEKRLAAIRRRQTSNLDTGVASNKYGPYECVRFVKDLVGNYSSWGNGARNLSHNSDGQVGDVAIFADIVHTGLVIGRGDNQVTVRHWMTIKTITGTHTYESVSVHYLSEFLGFHRF